MNLEFILGLESKDVLKNKMMKNGKEMWVSIEGTVKCQCCKNLSNEINNVAMIIIHIVT
jgi:hypothetical protein